MPGEFAPPGIETGLAEAAGRAKRGYRLTGLLPARDRLTPMTLALLAFAGVAQLVHAPHGETDHERLPEIAPAPAFTLISQDGARISLADLRGKVVAISFIYTLCGDTCPVLTPMMSLVQDRLGRDFGRTVAFVAYSADRGT